LLGACQKTTGGQVAAVVNDDEITQQEVRLEAEGQGATGSAALPAAARAGLVQRIVERNLLAGYARREGLDKGPEYVLRRRLLEQTLLATLAARKLAGTPVAPTPADVRAFIESNPTFFAKRERLMLDQIRFATPADGKKIQSLVRRGSTDQVAAQLNAEKIPFQRGAAALDTASVAPDVARQIVGLPAGQAFDITSGGTTYISAVTSRAPIASDPATWTAAATEAVRRDQSGKRVAAAVEKLRKEAKITYDSAYKPVTPKP
jgi:EpsD family peptidyl-prolyl cis-trans isomerase